MDWGPIVAGGVAGLGSGIVGGVGAPWVQLAVERRRERLARRRALVASWRQMVSRHHEPLHATADGLVDDADFHTLRPHLSADALEKLETAAGSTTKPVEVRLGATGLRANADLDLVATEIDRIEREWKLA